VQLLFCGHPPVSHHLQADRLLSTRHLLHEGWGTSFLHQRMRLLLLLLRVSKITALLCHHLHLSHLLLLLLQKNSLLMM
jgi:hypothetical protein